MEDFAPGIDATREQVVILICCYNGRQHLDELLPSLQASHEPRLDVRVVVVDDHSSDGSPDHLNRNYPWVDYIATGRNHGFAGANNIGWSYICRSYPDARFLVLLNQDTTVGNGWLTRLSEFLNAHPRAAAVQPKILLHARPDTLNTIGNRSHYLGFGMLTGHGQLDRGQYDEPSQHAFSSGCAAMLRTDLVREFGLFDERFFMYLEDADLGWRLRQAGYEVWSVPASRVFHKYVPRAHFSHYEFLERNRWILLLTYYRCWTLLVLVPAIVMMELGQLVFAATNGLLARKVASWRWFLRKDNLSYVLERRSRARLCRQVEDRQMLAMHVASVHLPTGDPFTLKWLGNPLFRVWWAIARHAVR